MRIGVDFDNTIANYDKVFGALARELELFDRLPVGGKRGLRDALRQRPGGEAQWQRLQSLAYGLQMKNAEPFHGAIGAISAWRKVGADVHIVSHKTRYANGCHGGVDLRCAALDWLKAKGFFSSDEPGLQASQVHFNDSRDDKLARIAALRLDIFIDDLEEVLTAPMFPKSVYRILFDPHHAAAANEAIGCCHNWQNIKEQVLVRNGI